MRTTRYSEPSDAEFDRAMAHTQEREDEPVREEEDEPAEEQLAGIEHP